MSRAPRAWVLNLDAEHELERPRGYTRSDRLEAIVRHQSQRLLGTLVGPQDLVLTAAALARDPLLAQRCASLEGLAWSPTPGALQLLRAAGARPVLSATLEVLRRVNARPFAAQVRAPLVRASFEKRVASTLEELLECVARPAADGWLVRRTYGAAGRGRRRIAAGAPDAAERAWLAASLRLGPLVVEPWVRVLREYTRSAWLQADGALLLSVPCFQAVDEHGAWTRTERAELDREARADDDQLAQAVEATGAALHSAGYSGPFGIDAYRHRLSGSTHSALNPLSEINARFTMDWASAMAQEPRAGEALAVLDGLLAKAQC